MLRQGMYANDDMRAPCFEKVSGVSDASPIKKFPRFRAKPINRPIKILHPALPMPQDPVIEADELLCYVMRFFNTANDPYRSRSAVPKFLQSMGDRLRRRTVSAAGV